jgi:hypothetical protein
VKGAQTEQEKLEEMLAESKQQNSEQAGHRCRLRKVERKHSRCNMITDKEEAEVRLRRGDPAHLKPLLESRRGKLQYLGERTLN